MRCEIRSLGYKAEHESQVHWRKLWKDQGVVAESQRQRHPASLNRPFSLHLNPASHTAYPHARNANDVTPPVADWPQVLQKSAVSLPSEEGSPSHTPKDFYLKAPARIWS